MAPTDRDTVEWQTEEIIRCLFNERLYFQGNSCIETDGPDDFDAIQIAEKLRSIADEMNENVAFQAALKELKTAAAKEAAEAAFSNGVDALCQSQVSRSAEVAPELQIIKASVAFGLYVRKSAPELGSTIQSIMANFLNRRVGTWVVEQGGWNHV